MKSWVIFLSFALFLTACSAPGASPAATASATATSHPIQPTETLTPTNIPPTATAAAPVYDFSAFDPADRSTWPDEMRVAYESLSTRPITADPANKEEFSNADKIIHNHLMKGLITDVTH